MTSDAVTREARVRRRTGGAAHVAGRSGLVCWGLVHLVVAYLAVRVAAGEGEEADQQGALQEVGSTGAGRVVLWVLAAGLLAFGLWQLLMAASGYGWEPRRGTRLRKRAGSGIRGVVVLALAYTAVRLVTGAGAASGNQPQQEFTARLLALPAGQALVAITGAIVVAVGGATVVKGITRGFCDDLDLMDLPSGTARWAEGLGLAGYVAKGMVYVVIGALLGYAALRSDAGQAGGVDKALRTLAAQPYGVVLLVFVAAGLAAFGVYCFAAARSHKS